MSNKVITFIQHHPYATAGGVVAIGVLILLFNSSGQTSSADGTSLSDVQAGSQIQQAQSAAQLQNNQIQAQANVASQQIAADVAIANLQATTSQNNNYTSAQAALTVAGLQAHSTDLVSTLTAQVNEADIQSKIDLAQIAGNQNIQISANNLAQTQSLINAQTEQFKIQTNGAIAVSNIQAQQAIQTQQIAANAQAHSSNNNLIGDIFGSILGSFF